MSSRFGRHGVACLLVCAVAALSAPARADDTGETESVQRTWRLLDYLAVDYGSAIVDGKVVSDSEYAEMVEFAQSAADRLAALPPRGQQEGLLRRARALQGEIANKAPAERIAELARGIAADLIQAYPVPLAPSVAPDFARGQQLFQVLCAGCHGAAGKGDGPLSAGLKPPPIDFTDRSRARERSIFGLNQVIELGLEGTSMVSFGAQSPPDRWALAFYAGSFAYPEEAAAEGEQIWKGDAALRQRFNLQKLVALTPAALATEVGEEKSTALMAYLRRNPDAVVPREVPGGLTVARAKLGDALAAYERGDRRAATELSLSAYLDGFEPIEPVLSVRDKDLMVRIENAMALVRSLMAKGAPSSDVRGQLAALDGLFGEAERALAPASTSASSSFIGAFTILLREGLEAILIVVGLIAFLRKAERPDMLRYVHGGWVAALGVGALTWAAATWVISISGASRELTEGFGSVVAAIVLLWVGVWLHGKSSAEAWQRYIREKTSHVLTRRSGWFMFGLAFVVVYREVFETILFYVAIWNQGNGGAVLGGALAGAGMLALIVWAMTRYSRTLPLGKFFAYSSALIALLAVVLIGKGVSALQEAGYLSVTPIANIPRIELVGLFPSAEGVVAQVAISTLLLSGFAWNRWRLSKQQHIEA